MSMYGEPDLADLLPAYYCNYMARGRREHQCSSWRGFWSHLLAMILTVGICAGGFYYYQNIHIISRNNKVSFSVESDTNAMSQTTSDDHPRFEEFDSTSSSSETLDMQINLIKEELTTIHTWRSSFNSVLTKMQWERDLKIHTAIVEALEIYSADGISIMDYAAAYAGGSILGISADTHPHPTHRSLSLFKIVNVDVLSSPEEIIRPCVLPGSCFAFRGRTGRIKIRLGKPLYVGGVTLSHASRLLLDLEGMSSAPKDFEVFGLTSETDPGMFLGKFTYNWMGTQHQTFPIKKELTKNQIFEAVELKILNNYGKEDFTCVYRFRVHKRDSDQSNKSSQTATQSPKKRKCC